MYRVYIVKYISTTITPTITLGGRSVRSETAGEDAPFVKKASEEVCEPGHDEEGSDEEPDVDGSDLHIC